MRRALAALALALGMMLAAAAPAAAHPLGNFTLNHLSVIQVAGAQLRVHYILDYAEIPTFQAQQDGAGVAPGYARDLATGLASGLRLTVDGTAVSVHPQRQSLQLLPGQGGLRTMRLEVVYGAGELGAGSHRLTYADDNFPERLGWREIVVQASGGASLANSTAPSTSVSDELRSYPQSLISSPLDVRSASFDAVPGGGVGTEPVLATATTGFRTARDAFSSLISGDASSPAFWVLALMAAVALGALHALEPGHGKAVMAGYLVGARGTRRQAVTLAVTITATHTAGVFALGIIVLFAAARVTPERLYPWLSLGSGLLILGVGASMLVSRWRRPPPGDGHHHGSSDEHDHEHDHDHEHEHEHRHGLFTHTHATSRQTSGWRVVLLGISGGLLPCPSALVVMLAAISLHRVAFGMALIVAFSLGLALVLTGLGLAVAGGVPLLRRVPRLRELAGGRLTWRLLPVASAAVVSVAGLAMTVQALAGGL